MAIFEDDPSTWQRLDFRLLQDGPVAMYFRAGVLEADTSWLAAHGYRIDPLDCRGWTTEAAAHATLVSALEFPDYYGRNLDAFNDCLSELHVPDEAGRVLVLTRYDVPAAAIPRFAAVLLDIVASQARRKLLFGRRLLALVQTDDPRLAFESVRACPVSWNPREWLNTARGL